MNFVLIYVAYAFDKVWHIGLINKLFKPNVPDIYVHTDLFVELVYWFSFEYTINIRYPIREVSLKV